MCKVEYYKSGELYRETPYKDGKIHGKVKEYYKDGKLKFETPYKDGEIEGVRKEYFSNGKIRRETPYKHNLIHGNVKNYSNGADKVIRLDKYRYGSLIKSFDLSKI